MSRICQGWQARDWIKYSDVCPYSIAHREKMHQPEFVKESLFRLYCSNTRMLMRRAPRAIGTVKRGGSEYRHGKLYKLYWRLHA